LNRPEASNALNTQMGLDLVELFEGLSTDIEGLRAVILTGSGAKAFCAGGDLKQRNGMMDEAWHAQHLVFERMLRAILGCPVPVIGAVNGAAYGGGCEIAAALDFVYAAGGSRDYDAAYQGFRGRPPSPAALFRKRGFEASGR